MWSCGLFVVYRITGRPLILYPLPPPQAQVYDCSTGDLSQELSGSGEPVLDLSPFTVNSDNYLGLLTAHKLLVYKWTRTDTVQ